MIQVLRSINGRLLVLLLSGGIGNPVSAADPVEQTFDLKIERGNVPAQMRVIRVKQGDLVKLRWTTDQPMTLHLHGYDIEHEVTPGAATQFAVKAYATGRYPINVHGLGEYSQGSSENEYTLVYLEVYPP